MESTPETKVHAVLGASSSKRWMTCPGSVRLSAGMPNESSIYAKEGTAAHQLAEWCLRQEKDAYDFFGKTVHVEGDAFEVNHDMAEAVQVYLDEVRRLVDEPEPGVLHVLDYKHGRGVPVEAEGNTQGLYYALGAVLTLPDRSKTAGRLMIEQRFSLSQIYPGLFGTNDACVVNTPIDTVEIVIVQPRCEHDDGVIRRWRVHIVDLLDWSVDLVAAAKATTDPEAPLAPGDHCKFCPAAPTCPALQEQVFDAAMADFGENSGELTLPEPTKLSSDELGALVGNAKKIESWIRSVLEYAHHEGEAGRMPTGYKLVQKRATRKWKDPDTVAEALESELGIDPGKIFNIKPASPAQIESVLKKDYGMKGAEAADALEGLYEKVSSGSTLAPLSDSRKSKAEEAVADFEPIEA